MVVLAESDIVRVFVDVVTVTLEAGAISTLATAPAEDAVIIYIPMKFVPAPKTTIMALDEFATVYDLGLVEFVICPKKTCVNEVSIPMPVLT